MNNDLISRSETEKLLRAYADKVGCERGEYELANGILKAVCFLEKSENVPAVSEGKWIPCSERLPESEKEVEITYIRKHCITGKTLYLTARAFYENRTVTTDESAFCWDNTDNWEYDEEKDCYVIPEGWFEGVSFAEEFEAIDMPVIAWREIVEPYRPDSLN